ncbi:unnamed protein product, partial [Laminaria digitata]
SCEGSVGSCVPCNGDLPMEAGTPPPVEGQTPVPVSSDESLPPAAIDADSCTTAMCEANANEEDSDYISDNSLSLYCDEKCFDTPNDPFGGLWCNMRGLGQPCRACRADK